MKQNLIIVLALTGLMAAHSTALAECINTNGDGDQDRNIGPFSMQEGASISVTMTTDQGDGTAIIIGDAPRSGEFIFSVQFTAEHQRTFQFSSSEPEVFIFLDWEYNGQQSNTYSVVTSDCQVSVPTTSPRGLVILGLLLLLMGTAVLRRRVVGKTT